MKSFIAINFPDEIKASLAKIRDRLKKSTLRGSFSLVENLHLTLVFLGECDVRQVEAVKSVMDETVFSRFTLTLDRVGYFKRDSGNTWWIGIEENRSLSVLQKDLSERLQQKGFILEDRPYVPHVTMGRMVKMSAGFVQPEPQHEQFDVTGIELMKSEHINGKLVYTPVYGISSK